MGNLKNFKKEKMPKAKNVAKKLPSKAKLLPKRQLQLRVVSRKMEKRERQEETELEPLLLEKSEDIKNLPPIFYQELHSTDWLEIFAVNMTKISDSNLKH